MTKTCRVCKKELPVIEFHKHNRTGYQSDCKDCKRLESRIRNRTPERREYNKLFLRKLYPKLKEEYYSRPDVKARRAKQAKEYRNDPEKRERYLAREFAKLAKNKGDLIPLPCEACGEGKVQMHHEDYSKPLEVIWLCEDCHYKAHGKRT